MKKNIFKKLFIRFSKILGFEIIDQNEFYSPTLKKELNKNLSNINKSIILPLGEVKLTRKIQSLNIIFRTNSNIEIWDQNKKRIFEQPKIEYVLRCLNSIIKSIDKVKKQKPNISINLQIVDDKSSNSNLQKLENLINKSKIDVKIIHHDNKEHKEKISSENKETFSNLSSLLKCFEIAKNDNSDLIYFVEDDYLHYKHSLIDMLDTYERISSQHKDEIIVCPSDLPFNYMSNEKTSVLIGSQQHWRTITKILCTFMISKRMFEKYINNFEKNCEKRHDPFEKYINEILQKEIAISPIKTLAIHLTNINSSYGLSPFVDYKKLWEENKVD
tara:strand:- start:99 stop:1088 length:990 start_codon:yes stop_codon:yes gene_type:complete